MGERQEDVPPPDMVNKDILSVNTDAKDDSDRRYTPAPVVRNVQSISHGYILAIQ